MQLNKENCLKDVTMLGCGQHYQLWLCDSPLLTSDKGSGEQVQAGNLRSWQLLGPFGPEGSVYINKKKR